MSGLLTYRQAVEILDPSGQIGVNVRTIVSLVKDGMLRRVKLPGVRSPLVYQQDIEALMEAPARRPMRGGSDQPIDDGRKEVPMNGILSPEEKRRRTQERRRRTQEINKQIQRDWWRKL